MSQFIAVQSPPGNVLSSYDRSVPYSDQKESIPTTFLDAMSVREEVFVKEQKVDLDRELDEDDPRSWHWVTYASVGASAGTQDNNHNADPNGKRDSIASRLPVGTVRLVPPPHPPHPTPGTSHPIDNSEVPASELPSPYDPSHSRSQSSGDNSATSTSNKEEPFIKIGRLATLAPYRKLGLGKLLIDSALDWAAKHPNEVLPPPSATRREQARAEGEGIQEIENETWRGLVLIHAQKRSEGLYAKWGFVTDESLGEWDEEGITHVGMWKRVPVQDK